LLGVKTKKFVFILEGFNLAGSDLPFDVWLNTSNPELPSFLVTKHLLCANFWAQKAGAAVKLGLCWPMGALNARIWNVDFCRQRVAAGGNSIQKC
jgi:hypothetical protein